MAFKGSEEKWELKQVARRYVVREGVETDPVIANSFFFQAYSKE